MKVAKMKKWLAVILAVVMGVSMTACAKEEDKEVVQPESETEEVVEFVEEEQEFEKNEEEEPEFEEEEEETEEEEEEESEGQISFDDVMESYDELVDVYDQINEMYMADDVPRDEGVEEILSTVKNQMEDIANLEEEDIPTDEDKLEVLKRIGELNNTLSELIDPLFEAAQATDQLAALVQANYDYMDSYYSAVWDHISEYGGTEGQVDALIKARDEIGEIGDISDATADELEGLNDRINYVNDLLDAICATM